MENKEIDEEDDFIGWLSEDPDDWYSFSDYEEKLRELVHEYNEEACCLGELLLGILGEDPLNTIMILSELNTSAMNNPVLMKRLEEIRWWARLRMDSSHPDDLDSPLADAEYQEGMRHWEANEYEEAFECYENAAIEGHEKAYIMLEHVFENGFVDKQRNMQRALSLGNRAILYGNAAAFLSDCYRNGAGCEANAAKADYWNSVSQELSEKREDRKWISRCVKSGLLERYLTAGQIHFFAMNEIRYWWDNKKKTWRPRITPTKEQAKDYVNCVKTLRSFYTNSYPEDVTHIEAKEARLLEKKVKQYEGMHLDMRDVLTLDKHFKYVLRRVTGEVVVPPQSYSPTESYDYIDSIRESWGAIWCVPVHKGDKYALCKMDGKGTLMTGFDYDRMYRYFGGYVSDFVVEQNCKKGLISQSGKVIIPCKMDQIIEMIDPDGIVPFKKDGKWGMAFGVVCTEPIFDDIMIEAENYACGRIGKDWFWVDEDGKPTSDKRNRFFGSWYDSAK